MNKFSNEEKKVAKQHGLTEQQYLAKRQAYVKKKGVSLEELVVLTPEDFKVIEQFRTDPDQFLSGKLEDLAKRVVNS